MRYALIQKKIDHGIGIAGKHLGQPFSAYRVVSDSAGDFPDAWRLLTQNLALYRERVPEPKLETGLNKGAIWYNIYADMSPYNLGDVFVCTDPPFSPGVSYGANATILPGTLEINALSLAWHMPARVPTGARLDHLVRIYRPAGEPATLSDGSKYWKSTLDNDQPLILWGGEFTFGQPGSNLGSVVPCGFVAAYRPSGAFPFGPPVPGMIRPTHWYGYLPPLPGYEPREGDAVITIDDARYLVVDPYRQEAGVVGSQLLLDRQISQAS